MIKKHILRFFSLNRSLRKIFSKTKSARFYNRVTFNNIIKKNIELIDSFQTKDFNEFSKEEYFKIQKTLPIGVVEINNSCNINCTFCNTKDSPRIKQLMDLKTFDSTLLHLKSLGIHTLSLHTIGDPLANVRLGEYLKAIRNNGMRVGYLSTNGLLLHKHIDTLIEYKDIIGPIRFSIDGSKKETYEKIRVGGDWNLLMKNLDLGQKTLMPHGYEFLFDFTITKENRGEIGEFFVMMQRFAYSKYNIHFNLMNSLAPDNHYFEKYNVLPNHTHPKSYCQFVRNMHPYVLADGKISICCRDYDGSLVYDNVHANKKTAPVENSRYEAIRDATENQTITEDNFPLCNKCYIVDTRLQILWENTLQYIKFKVKDGDPEAYQRKFIELLSILDNVDKQKYNKFIKNL